MVICGIDPGLKGYACLLNADTNTGYMYKLKFDKDKVFDAKEFFHFMLGKKVSFTVIEKVWSIPKSSVTACFNFGKGYGQILSVVNLCSSFATIPPKTWQASLCKGISSNNPKERSLIAYNRLFPNDPLTRNRVNKINDNMVDALLIACYGIWNYAQQPLRKWEIIEVSS